MSHAGSTACDGLASEPHTYVLQLERVERLGSEAWQGVAQVDRGSTSQLDGRWLATLVAGDTAALMVFAAIGRYSHFHDLDLLAISSIAAPFLLGEQATVGTD